MKQQKIGSVWARFFASYGRLSGSVTGSGIRVISMDSSMGMVMMRKGISPEQARLIALIR